jgi:PleD family two-component response regulator
MQGQMLIIFSDGDEFLLVFNDYNINQAELAIKRINNKIDEFNMKE